MHETECSTVPNVGMNLMRMLFMLIYTHASSFNCSHKCVIFSTCKIIDSGGQIRDVYTRSWPN